MDTRPYRELHEMVFDRARIVSLPVRHRTEARTLSDPSARGDLGRVASWPTLPFGLLALTALSACSGDSPTDPGESVATTVNLSAQQITFTSLGETHHLSASVGDQNGSVMTSTSLTWSSSNPHVAPVAPTGIVTAVANGTATLTATSGNASGAATVTVEQVAVTVEFAPLYLELDDVGDAATVEARVLDGRDNVMPDASLVWTTSDPSVAEVSAEGLVTATGEGAAAVTATVPEGGSGPGSVGTPTSGSLSVFVGPRILLVTGIQPAVLVEGSPALMEGAGFAPVAADNVVTLAGLPVQGTSASATALDIVVPNRDCQPPRQEELVVDVLGLSATGAARVSPANALDLAVGEGAFATDGCLPLVAGTGGEQYLVGALSTSEVASELTAVVIGGLEGDAPVASPRVLASGAASRSARNPTASAARGTFSVPVEPGAEPVLRTGDASRPAFTPRARPDYRSGEAEIRRRDRAILEALGPAGPLISGDLLRASGAGPLAAVPSVGEMLNLNVPSGCSVGVSVEAEVRYVGTAAVWLEDVDNPVQSFTTQEYQRFDALLSEHIVPTITSYFGPFEDIDRNGRTLVLVTKAVNERHVGGFVTSVDLLPTGACPAGNFAEIFYGAALDPAGTFGPVFTTEEAVNLYPRLITHELAHVSQLTRIVLGTASLKASWELEGGATLAEQLVGFRVLGHGPGQDLGHAQWSLGIDGGWYSNWVNDLASYFGLLGSTKAVGAPEECSWVGGVQEGNSGPCDNVRAVYGTPATLLRWVLDVYGPTSGGEAALMRELTGSPHSGFATLTEATGESEAYLLTQFATGLWADGRLGDWLPSWNLFDIFQNQASAARLVPYASTSAQPSLEVSVRAGSSAYLEWSPPEPHASTSLRLRDTGGGAAPNHMVLWVLRVS